MSALLSAVPLRGDLAAGSSKTFRLTPQPGRAPIFPAPHPETEIWGYDGLVPGPEIRVRQGDEVTVHVVNKLAQPTTVHWHGLRDRQRDGRRAGSHTAAHSPERVLYL